ncbi:MAG: hypothetical protein ACXIUB_04450 [Wenzhouxiangella sp.]
MASWLLRAVGTAALTLGLAAASLAEPRLLADMAVCTSMTPEHCAERIHWPSQARRHDLYQINESALMRWALAVDAVPGNDAPIERLDWLRQHIGEQTRTRAALLALLWPADNRWSIAEQQKLLDHLELEQAGREEQVSLVDSRDQAEVSALKQRVAALPRRHGDQPLIAINAAGQDDPYGPLAGTHQVLEQAGAEVVWLPLDAALRRARAEQNCLGLPRYQALELQRYRRDQVQPEAFRAQLAFCLAAGEGLALLNQADALFVIGDDADLMARAWTGSAGLPTTELMVLRERHRSGDIVLLGRNAHLLLELIEQQPLAAD